MHTLTTFSGLVNRAQEANTDVLTMFSVLSSNEETKRFRNLLSTTKESKFFEYSGTYFKGDRRIAAIQFMLNNPQPADFYVWLQSNYTIYNPAK